MAGQKIFTAAGQDQEHGQILWGVQNLFNQPEAARISPLDIFQDNQSWLIRCCLAQERFQSGLQVILSFTGRIRAVVRDRASEGDQLRRQFQQDWQRIRSLLHQPLAEPFDENRVLVEKLAQKRMDDFDQSRKRCVVPVLVKFPQITAAGLAIQRLAG